MCVCLGGGGGGGTPLEISSGDGRYRGIPISTEVNNGNKVGRVLHPK